MPGIARHTPTLLSNSATRLIVADVALLPHIGELLTQLTNPDEWYKAGDDIADIVAASWDMVMTYYANSLVGQIASFALESPPGWLDLDGSTYAQSNYPELTDKVPSDWLSGSNIVLPDLDGVYPAGSGSTGTPGDTVGSNTITLSVNQLPEHTHTYTPPIANIDLEAPGAPDILAAGLGTTTNTGSTGSGDDIDIRPETIVVVMAIYAGRI
jgi:microcystin-dependent protein